MPTPKHTWIAIIIALISIVTFYSSCVSRKKYQLAVGELNTVKQRLKDETTQSDKLNYELTKFKISFEEHLRKDSLAATNISENNASNLLLPFPNPPPSPSTTFSLNQTVFKECKTFGDVNNKIITALQKAGYDNRISYFLFDGGFVITTPFEQINIDGGSKLGNERWSLTNSLSGLKSFTLKEYLKSLFIASPGYYRSFAFIVSPTIYRLSNENYSKDLLSKYMSLGSNGVPDEILSMKTSNSTKYTVLIYEYKKSENSNESELVLGGISGLQHLKNSNILNAIANGNGH